MNVTVHPNRLAKTLFIVAVFFRILPISAQEDHLELLQTMKTEVDKQLRGVEFKCTYTYSEHVVDTREEAERFDTSKGRLVVHATGVLAKTKKMTYESFELDTLETKMPEYRLDHITVTNPELRVNYAKQSLRSPQRTLLVDERREKNKDLPILDDAYAAVISPLLLGGGRARPNFLDKVFHSIEHYPKETEITIIPEGDLTKIFRHREIPDIEISDISYTVSNLHPYPVLVDKTDDYVLPNGEQIHRHLKAHEFVQLNDGCVLPQKIHMFSPIVWDDFGEEDIGKWLVTKWESEDMGKEKPKKSDFYIYLDRNSDIGGLALNLNYKLETNLPEYFDINKYSVRDLQSSSPLESQVNKTFDLSIWFRPLILLIAGVLIFLGCWSKWKSSRDSAS
jgi:hypothetical protein